MKMNWFGPMKTNLISLNTEFDALKSMIIKKEKRFQMPANTQSKTINKRYIRNTIYIKNQVKQARRRKLERVEQLKEEADGLDIRLLILQNHRHKSFV